MKKNLRSRRTSCKFSAKPTSSTRLTSNKKAHSSMDNCSEINDSKPVTSHAAPKANCVPPRLATASFQSSLRVPSQLPTKVSEPISSAMENRPSSRALPVESPLNAPVIIRLPIESKMPSFDLIASRNSQLQSAKPMTPDAAPIAP